jgi:EPS-associated MarR family transcriptional regulator
MNEHDVLNEEALHIIREVHEDPSVNQRILSERLNISLGKTNYLLKALAQKGLIKIANFTKHPKKGKAVQYLLTKRGLKEKADLTYHFLKVKEKEYERLKAEYSRYIADIKKYKNPGGDDA